MIQIARIERRARKRKQKIKIMTEQRIKELEDAEMQGEIDWNKEDVDELCDFALLCLDGKAFKGYGAIFRIEIALEFLRAAVFGKEHRQRGVRAQFHLGRVYRERIVPEGKNSDKIAWIHCTSAAWGGVVDAMVLIAKMGESGVSYSHDNAGFRHAFNVCEKYKPEDPESLKLPYIWALVAQKQGCDEVGDLIKSFESKLEPVQRIECKGKAEDRNSRIPLLDKSESDNAYANTDVNALLKNDDYKGTDDGLLLK